MDISVQENPIPLDELSPAELFQFINDTRTAGDIFIVLSQTSVQNHFENVDHEEVAVVNLTTGYIERIRGNVFVTPMVPVNGHIFVIPSVYKK